VAGATLRLELGDALAELRILSGDAAGRNRLVALLNGAAVLTSLAAVTSLSEGEQDAFAMLAGTPGFAVGLAAAALGWWAVGSRAPTGQDGGRAVPPELQQGVTRWRRWLAALAQGVGMLALVAGIVAAFVAQWRVAGT
jgi:hypothetical protein